MEDENRKQAVYLDLQEVLDPDRRLKREPARTPEEAASLEERYSSWLDLLDR